MGVHSSKCLRCTVSTKTFVAKKNITLLFLHRHVKKYILKHWLLMQNLPKVCYLRGLCILTISINKSSTVRSTKIWRMQRFGLIKGKV